MSGSRTSAVMAVVLAVAFLAVALMLAGSVRGSGATGDNVDDTLFCTPTPTPFNPNAPTARATRTPGGTSGGFSAQLLPACDTPTPSPSPSPTPTPSPTPNPNAPTPRVTRSPRVTPHS